MDQEAILEGILFAFGEEGISPDQLSMALGLSSDLLEVFLDEYEEKLKKNNRGIELVRFGGSIKSFLNYSVSIKTDNCLRRRSKH